MKRITYDNKEKLISWAADRIAVDLKFRPDAKAIGLERDGKLAAVVVYDCFSVKDCNIHIASDGSKRWFDMDFIVSAFSYPFIQLNLNRVTGLVPSKNKQALSFDLRMGFVQEGVCRKALPDDDVIILGMLKEECRYLPKGV